MATADTCSRSDGGFALAVEVPANVTATVVLPGTGEIMEGGVDARTAPGVHALRREDGSWIAEIGSGSYDFLVAPCA
jgi:hypothetical protein